MEFFKRIDPLYSLFEGNLYHDTVTAGHAIGHLCREWAERLGLKEGTAVAMGAIDCHAGAVGAGIRPGVLVKVIGTSTCDIVVAPEVPVCVRGICGQVNGSVIPGMIGLEAGQSAFGDVYAWFRRLLGYAGEISIAQLEREAAEIRPGSTGILAFDWFNGRRTPDANPHLRGGILGLNLGSSAPMVYRALAESNAAGSSERFVTLMLRVIREALLPFSLPETEEESRARQALAYFSAHPKGTVAELAVLLGCSKRSAERLVASLRKDGKLRREGSARGGTWVVGQ